MAWGGAEAAPLGAGARGREVAAGRGIWRVLDAKRRSKAARMQQGPSFFFSTRLEKA